MESVKATGCTYLQMKGSIYGNSILDKNNIFAIFLLQLGFKEYIVIPIKMIKALRGKRDGKIV